MIATVMKRQPKTTITHDDFRCRTDDSADVRALTMFTLHKSVNMTSWKRNGSFCIVFCRACVMCIVCCVLLCVVCCVSCLCDVQYVLCCGIVCSPVHAQCACACAYVFILLCCMCSEYMHIPYLISDDSSRRKLPAERRQKLPANLLFRESVIHPGIKTSTRSQFSNYTFVKHCPVHAEYAPGVESQLALAMAMANS